MIAEEWLLAHPMDESALGRAFPLAANLSPNLTLNRWNEFTRSFLVRRGEASSRGFMGIQNVAGHILGLFSFEIRDGLQQGRTLCVDNIVVPTFPGRNLIWRAIIDAIDNLAARNDCRLISADLTGKLNRVDADRKWIGLALERAGYLCEETTVFRRQTVTPTALFLSSMMMGFGK